MSFYKDSIFRTFFCMAFAFACVLAAGLSFGGELPVNGKKTLFLYKSSSACEIRESQSPFVVSRAFLKGEAVCLKNEEQLRVLLSELRAEKIFSERGKDFYCEYYYSPKLRYEARIDGRRINLHVSKSKNGITAGAPLIFGSF